MAKNLNVAGVLPQVAADSSPKSNADNGAQPDEFQKILADASKTQTDGSPDQAGDGVSNATVANGQAPQVKQLQSPQASVFPTPDAVNSFSPKGQFAVAPEMDERTLEKKNIAAGLIASSEMPGVEPDQKSARKAGDGLDSLPPSDAALQNGAAAFPVNAAGLMVAQIPQASLNEVPEKNGETLGQSETGPISAAKVPGAALTAATADSLLSHDALASQGLPAVKTLPGMDPGLTTDPTGMATPITQNPQPDMQVQANADLTSGMAAQSNSPSTSGMETQPNTLRISGMEIQPNTISASGMEIQPNAIRISGMAVQPNTITTSGMELQPNIMTLSGMEIQPNAIRISGMAVQPNTVSASGLEVRPNMMTLSGMELQPNAIAVSGMEVQPNLISPSGMELRPDTISVSGMKAPEDLISPSEITIQSDDAVQPETGFAELTSEMKLQRELKSKSGKDPQSFAFGLAGSGILQAASGVSDRQIASDPLQHDRMSISNGETRFNMTGINELRAQNGSVNPSEAKLQAGAIGMGLLLQSDASDQTEIETRANPTHAMGLGRSTGTIDPLTPKNQLDMMRQPVAESVATAGTNLTNPFYVMEMPQSSFPQFSGTRSSSESRIGVAEGIPTGGNWAQVDPGAGLLLEKPVRKFSLGNPAASEKQPDVDSNGQEMKFSIPLKDVIALKVASDRPIPKNDTGMAANQDAISTAVKPGANSQPVFPAVPLALNAKIALDAMEPPANTIEETAPRISEGPASAKTTSQMKLAATDSFAQPTGKTTEHGLAELSIPVSQHFSDRPDAASETSLSATRHSGHQMTAEAIYPQIIERAKMMVGNGQHEMEVSLKPEHLGRIQLKVSMEKNQQVTAKIVAENQQVKEIIENHLPALRQQLQDTGLQVDTLTVSAGQQNGTGQPQQNGYQQSGTAPAYASRHQYSEIRTADPNPQSSDATRVKLRSMVDFVA